MKEEKLRTDDDDDDPETPSQVFSFGHLTI